MRLLVKMLKQDATYWAPGKVNDSGEFQPELPINIKCRWEDELEQGLDSGGVETTFKSTVYTDRDVEEGGLLRLGLKETLHSPNPPEDSHRIRMFSKIPTLDAKQFLRTAKL